MLKMKKTACSEWWWVVEGGWCEINSVDVNTELSAYIIDHITYIQNRTVLVSRYF